MLRFGVVVLWLALALSAVPGPVQAVCENFVSGTVFLDIDGNGIQEPTEPYTSGLVRLEQNGQLYAEKLAEAEFGFIFEHVPCGTYQVYLNGAFVTDITVDDAGPSQSLTLAQPARRVFLPYIRMTDDQ